jgi:hypothetical protein
MDDMIQTPEAQKLAQMLQQQQMQKILQSIQGGMGSGAMSEVDRQQMGSAQRDYGMNVGSVPMPAPMQQQGDFMQAPVQMMGRPIPQNSMGGMAAKSAPMPTVRGDGYMSNYEMMRKR